MMSPLPHPLTRVALVLVVAACSGGDAGSGRNPEPSAPGAEPARGPYGLSSKQAARPILIVGDQTISLASFAERIGRPPLRRGRPPEHERRMGALDEMLQLELFAHEARRRGYTTGAQSATRRKRAMVDAFVDALVGAQGSEVEPVTDRDVEAFFEENRDRFDRPETARAFHILLPSRKAASKLLSRLLQSPEDHALFTSLARAHSEDELTRDRGGDLSFFTRKQPSNAPEAPADATTRASLRPPQVPQAVRDVAFSLSRPGAIHTEPVQSELGFHLVKLTGRRKAAKAELPPRMKVIREALQKEQRDMALDRFLSGAGRARRLATFPSKLALIRLPPP